jgi:AcrR family transcriptional regulator
MTPRRTRMTAEGRREQLLDRCAAIVDAEGFHAVTLQRVAEECGVTRTVIYQQFGGLDGMLDALVERAGARAATAVTPATGATRAPSLRSVMTRVLAAVDADPSTWRMFLVAPQVGPAALADSLAQGRAMLRDLTMAALEDGPDAPDDPELAARMLQAVADELVRLRLADPTVYTTERIVAQFDALGEALLHERRSVPP